MKRPYFGHVHHFNDKKCYMKHIYHSLGRGTGDKNLYFLDERIHFQQRKQNLDKNNRGSSNESKTTQQVWLGLDVSKIGKTHVSIRTN